MNWITMAVASALGYSAANALTKIYQSKLPLIAGVGFFAFGIFVTSLITLLLTKSSGDILKHANNYAGIAALAGLIWFFAQFLFVDAMSKNAPISLLIPFVTGGIAIGGVITGLLFFGETLSTIKIIGVIVVLIGTVMLSR